MSVYDDPAIQSPAVDPGLFALDPSIVFLNHGSFGSCPIAVLEYQNGLRKRMERQPVQFLARDLEDLLDESRRTLGEFVGADPDDLVFVPNATSGVNAVLRSIRFQPGDELLVTDHEYNACRNAINYAAELGGAKVVTVRIPFPLSSPDEVIAAVMAKVSEKTRLLVIDHVTSPTGLILPIQSIVNQLNELGIDTFVDGAHAPGMIPVNIEEIGAAYYTGNCHKWLCAPKGAGFLHVQKNKQEEVRPLIISHGANSPRTDRSRFQIEFAWMGTNDPTAALCLPRAIEYMGSLLPGGWSEIMDRNRKLALAARKIICLTFNVPSPSPDSMIGSLASIPLPDSRGPEPLVGRTQFTRWQNELMARCKVEVPIIPWPSHPHRLVRISAQVYNFMAQYDLLAEGLKELGDDQVS
jgi:isopenicillin-N epimerase